MSSSSSSLSPPHPSDDGSAVPSTASSNYTLLYIIIAVLAGVILYVAIRYGRSVLAEWRQLQAGHGGTPGGGLSVDDIAALPTFTYRARAASASPYAGGNGRRSCSKQGRAAAAECVVCLQELEDGDVVRVLPACRHFFHDGCIDSWLCAHATCPVCRAHPEPPGRARLGEAVAAVSPPLPQLRRCGASPERGPTASRILADILERSPLMSKSPSPRVHFGSRSSSPTPAGYGRVDDRWAKSPPPGVSEIVIIPSNSPSPIRFSRQLSPRSIGMLESTEVIASASPPPGVSEIMIVRSMSPPPIRFSRQLSPRSIGVLGSMEVTTAASPSPVPIREDGGGSLSKSLSPVPH